MMTLASGASTGKKAEANKKSDQILLVQKGKLTGVVDPGKVCLKKGDVLLIPARGPRRFTNKTRSPAVTLNVYAPLEYPAGTKGQPYVARTGAGSYGDGVPLNFG
jgi:mannose-6-phosphate isomerase-like protein (cupin superfamily)